MWSFVFNKAVGEVVFSLRSAYQANNTFIKPSPGDLYDEINEFANAIVQERKNHASRVEGERMRESERHRAELEEAREAAKALTSRKKVRFHFFSFTAVNANSFSPR